MRRVRVPEVVGPVESHTQKVRFGYHDPVIDEFVIITDDVTAEMFGEIPVAPFDVAAHELGCSEALLRSMAESFNWLRDAIHQDMVDLWDRVDNAQ